MRQSSRNYMKCKFSNELELINYVESGWGECESESVGVGECERVRVCVSEGVGVSESV